MVREARAGVVDADHGYAAAHQNAATAGWAEAALRDLGYPAAPPRKARPRSVTSAATAPATAPPESEDSGTLDGDSAVA